MNARNIVELHWPYDGPHAAGNVTSAASAVSALVRYMNNATYDPSLLQGPDLHEVLTGLHEAVVRCDQLINHLVGTTLKLVMDATLYDDRADASAPSTAGLVAGKLRDARTALAVAAQQLNRAAGAADHLGHRPDGAA